MNIAIVTLKSWNLDNAIGLADIHPEYSVIISSSLIPSQIKEFNPDYIFFPHWSSKIPKEIYENYVCIAFHITDLPYGRGGSPLQNLISRKIHNTKITAFRVTDELDAGDIYCQEDLDISEGNAEQIFNRVSKIIFNRMIPAIIEDNYQIKQQSGDIVVFKRRTPEQSNLDSVGFLDVYDHIRMLDGEGYPPAFIDTKDLHVVFKNARKENKVIKGVFEIHEK